MGDNRARLERVSHLLKDDERGITSKPARLHYQQRPPRRIGQQQQGLQGEIVAGMQKGISTSKAGCLMPHVS
jgi:hypothetical protein